MELPTVQYLQNSLSITKLMLVYGTSSLVVSIFLYQSKTSLIKGTSIPIFLLAILFIVYGIYSILSHQKELFLASQLSDFDLVYITNEKYKMKSHIHSYNFAIMIWTVFLVLGICSSLLIKDSFYKGVLIGSSMLFLSTLLADIILRKETIKYLAKIEKHHRDYKQSI